MNARWASGRLLIVLPVVSLSGGCAAGAIQSPTPPTPAPASLPSVTATSAPAISGRTYEGRFVLTGKLTVARADDTATLLPDGRVVIAGGGRDGGLSALASAELYDPAHGTFRPTGSLNTTESGQTTTLLPDGRVFVAGGWNGTRAALVGEFYE